MKRVDIPSPPYWDEREQLRSLAKRLKAARVKCGITQAQLAKKVRIHPQQISNIERASAWPSCPIYLRLSAALAAALPEE